MLHYTSDHDPDATHVVRPRRIADRDEIAHAVLWIVESLWVCKVCPLQVVISLGGTPCPEDTETRATFLGEIEVRPMVCPQCRGRIKFAGWIPKSRPATQGAASPGKN